MTKHPAARRWNDPGPIVPHTVLRGAPTPLRGTLQVSNRLPATLESRLAHAIIYICSPSIYSRFSGISIAPSSTLNNIQNTRFYGSSNTGTVRRYAGSIVFSCPTRSPAYSVKTGGCPAGRPVFGAWSTKFPRMRWLHCEWDRGQSNHLRRSEAGRVRHDRTEGTMAPQST